MTEVSQMSLAIAQSRLDDLKYRLEHAHLPQDYANEEWRYGTNGDYLRELIDYWIDDFDWRRQEDEMNTFSHFRVTIDRVPIHFILERGVGPSPLPLVLSHGWPWTFWDFKDVIRQLADPASFGGDPQDSFDIVVPSLPGFVFSTPLTSPGINWWRTSDLWATLMCDVLGYERFGAHGSDWGAAISLQLGHKYHERVIGVHTTVAAPLSIFGGDRPWDFVGEMLNGADDAFRSELIAYDRRISAHVAVNVLSPQTIAYALHDSPAGLCAWLVERRRAWSDCDGDVERSFSKDELLTHTALYWLTDCLATSVRYYHEAAARPWQPTHDRTPVVQAPTGFTLFERDAPVPPIEYLRDAYDLRFHRFSERGGHFAAAEQPGMIVQDLREMFRPLR